MKILILAGVACLAAAPALAQPLTQQALLGKWTCQTNTDTQKVTSALDYSAGGKATYTTNLASSEGGMAIEIVGSGNSDWVIQPDGKLKETITSIKVSSAKMGGQVMEPAMMQTAIEASVLNQTTTSTVTLSGGGMTMVETTGITTTCKR